MTPPPDETPILLIRPSAPWWRLDLREFSQFRDLLFFLVWRNVKIRYKQTVMGFAWVIIQPLLTAAVFTVFFGRMAGLSSDGSPYPLFAFSALVVWGYFAGALTLASSSLISDANLIRKVYFPRLFLPITGALTGWVDFLISLGVLLVMMPFFGYWPHWGILWTPVLLILATWTAFAVSLWLSALDIQFHDIRYTIPFLTQLWMFLSPVVYSVTAVRDTLGLRLWVYGLNPMASVIVAFRWALGLGPAPDAGMLVASGAVLVVLSISGLWYFRRTEKFFADVI